VNNRQKGTASVSLRGTLAVSLGAPSGAYLRPQFTIVPTRCQDPEVTCLRAAAKTARAQGDRPAWAQEAAR